MLYVDIVYARPGPTNHPQSAACIDYRRANVGSASHHQGIVL